MLRSVLLIAREARMRSSVPPASTEDPLKLSQPNSNTKVPKLERTESGLSSLSLGWYHFPPSGGRTAGRPAWPRSKLPTPHKGESIHCLQSLCNRAGRENHHCSTPKTPEGGTPTPP
ncbi:unnamed protein product [Heterosigma akashiwo]